MCEIHSWNVLNYTLTVIFTALEREIMQLFQGATTSMNSPQANAVCLHAVSPHHFLLTSATGRCPPRVYFGGYSVIFISYKSELLLNKLTVTR